MDQKKTSLEMGKRLKKLREEKGLSHEKLRNAIKEKYEIDISKDSLINYETSVETHSKAYKNNGMKVEYLRCFADFYGVSSDYLLGLTNTRSPNPKVDEIRKYTGLTEKAVEILSFYNDVEEGSFVSVVSKLIEQEEWVSEVVDDGICDEFGNPVLTVLDGVMSETPILSTIKNFLAIERNSQKVYQLVGEEFFDKRGLIVRDTLRHIPASDVKELILLNDIETMLKKFKEKNAGK